MGYLAQSPGVFNEGAVHIKDDCCYASILAGPGSLSSVAIQITAPISTFPGTFSKKPVGDNIAHHQNGYKSRQLVMTGYHRPCAL